MKIRIMEDWADKLINAAKQMVYDQADQLIEERIAPLRARIMAEGATVIVINDPSNEQVKIDFDNISDELKEAVLCAARGETQKGSH